MKLKYIIAIAASAAVFTSCEKAEEATGEAAAAVEAAAKKPPLKPKLLKKLPLPMPKLLKSRCCRKGRC